MHKTPLRKEWRFNLLRESLASQVACGRWLFPPYLICRPARPVARFFGGFSCRASAFLLAVRNLSSSLYITGTLYVAIRVPFALLNIFSNLATHKTPRILDYGRRKQINLPKNIETPLSVGTSGSSACPARLQESAGSAFRTAGTANPSASIRSAQAGRIPASHRRPHSPTPTSLPSESHAPLPL
jgi:hypothetical protein